MKIEELINNAYETLSEGERALGKYILEHKKEISSLGISRLAEICLSSKSSILRFSQKLGFSGYTEMKNFLKWETHVAENNITQKDFGKLVIKNVEETVNHLNEQNLLDICEAIETSANVYLIGTGPLQQGLTHEMQRIFLGMGKNLQIVPIDINTTIYQLVIERISEKDMIIAFSGSGNNMMLQEGLQIPIMKKVKILAITGSTSNWLMNNANYGLTVHINRYSNIVSTSSAFYSTIDILAYHYFEYKNNLLTKTKTSKYK